MQINQKEDSKMKKVMCFTVIVMFVAAVAMAQDVPAPAQKQASIEELQWKAMYLNERIKTLQAEFKTVQDTLKVVQDELKARQPAAVPKEATPPKDAPPADKKAKK